MNYIGRDLTAHCSPGDSQQALGGLRALHGTQQSGGCRGSVSLKEVVGKPVSLWQTSLRCDRLIKEMWCPSGGCVPMRNRKPSSSCLPACLQRLVAPAGAGVPTRRRASSLQASWQAALFSSNIWKRRGRGGEETQPKAKTPPSL